MLLFITLLLITTPTLTTDCPTSVTDQLQLISQPVDCFRQLYNYKKFNNQKMMRVVTDRIHTYQRLLQQLKMSEQQPTVTAPVLKWAQSTFQIFISFKLSHRQDSPTCSDIRQESFQTTEVQEAEGDIDYKLVNYGFSNTSLFDYQGQCYFTNQKFLFKLHLQFQNKLIKITLKKQGLGLYSLVGEKSQAAIWWQRPFIGFKKAAIWSQLRQKHSQHMDLYFSKIEQVHDQQEKANKKRPKKRPKKTATPTPAAQTPQQL